MKALILAAGFGKRLEPYTRHTPKPLFTISNQPILDRLIRKLSSAGISSVMVNTHHLHQQIETYLATQTYAVPVATRHESDILGTGGAIKNLTDFWDDEPFLVINSDILFDTDLDLLCHYHMNNGSMATLMLCDHPLFNQVWIDRNRHILGFGANPSHLETQMTPLTFTGIQIIDPALLDFIPEQGFYSVIEAYKTALRSKKKLRAYLPDRLTWADMGSPDRYRASAIQSMAREAILSITRHPENPKIHLHKLSGDGSDRLWYRVTSGDASIIMVDHGIRTGPATQEVDSFIGIGKHLSTKDVPVPAIILSDPFSGLVFLEDLGDVHLQDMVLQNKTDTDVILRLYHTTIDALIHMALTGRDGFDPKWAWQSVTYDPSVVLEKECRYFVAAFLNRYLDMDVSFRDLKSEFVYLADHVADGGVVGFMHRDMQSRNIMVHENRCFIIDFQGGRTGPLQYDLASLLWDPYVALSQETISGLYNYYVQRLSTYCVHDETLFRKGFETCAITRNLQILGAFGHLSRNKGKHYFEAYIPRALQTLCQNLENYHARDRLSGLRKIALKADDVLKTKSNK